MQNIDLHILFCYWDTCSFVFSHIVLVNHNILDKNEKLEKNMEVALTQCLVVGLAQESQNQTFARSALGENVTFNTD